VGYMGIGDYIMNYLTDEEQYVKGICNNNENMIINELNESFNENMNRLNSFLNSVTNLTENFRFF
jgi:hypothetical protein